jgi:hypothetical protein
MIFSRSWPEHGAPCQGMPVHDDEPQNRLPQHAVGAKPGHNAETEPARGLSAP